MSIFAQKLADAALDSVRAKKTERGEQETQRLREIREGIQVVAEGIRIALRVDGEKLNDPVGYLEGLKTAKGTPSQYATKEIDALVGVYRRQEALVEALEVPMARPAVVTRRASVPPSRPIAPKAAPQKAPPPVVASELEEDEAFERTAGRIRQDTRAEVRERAMRIARTSGEVSVEDLSLAFRGRLNKATLAAKLAEMAAQGYLKEIRNDRGRGGLGRIYAATGKTWESPPAETRAVEAKAEAPKASPAGQQAPAIPSGKVQPSEVKASATAGEVQRPAATQPPAVAASFTPAKPFDSAARGGALEGIDFLIVKHAERNDGISVSDAGRFRMDLVTFQLTLSRLVSRGHLLQDGVRYFAK